MKVKIKLGGIVRYVDEYRLGQFLALGYKVVPPKPEPPKSEPKVERPEIVFEKENDLMFGKLYISQISTRRELYQLFDHLGIPYRKNEPTPKLIEKRDAYIASVKGAKKK